MSDSSKLEDAFGRWEGKVDELAEAAVLLQRTVKVVGKLRGRAKWRATEAAERMREAVAEALGSESRASKQWVALTNQGDLFKKSDGELPAAPDPPSGKRKGPHGAGAGASA